MSVRKVDCIFCKIVKGEIKSERIFESERFIAIRDIKPFTPGHTLVIPKKHFVTLLDLPDSWGEEFLRIMKRVAGKLMDDKLGDGFNIVMNNLEVSGQVVMHAHVHLIPRREGDEVRVLH
jgi:histidine triad (HIT) family protein